jgi:hypothetical protein
MAADTNTHTQRTTYRSVFAVAEFRTMFAGLLMFILGFEFEILGLSVLVYTQTKSGFLAAVTFGMGFMPQAIGGAFLTSLADRLSPRAVITGSLFVRAAPGLVIGLWPAMPLAAKLILLAVAATVTPLFIAANSGLLPDVLDGDRYVLGRSVFSSTDSGVQVIGLGIGGGILAGLPARWLLLAAGGSLVLAGIIMRLGLKYHPARAGSRSIRGVVRATMTGNAELLASPRIRSLLLAQWLPVWFITGAEALIIPYTASRGYPPSAASPLLAAVPIGMLIGDVIVGRFCRASVREWLAFPLAVLVGAPLLVAAFRPPLFVIGAALFLSGLGCSYQLGIQKAFLDSLSPDMRGRAFGLRAAGELGGEGLIPSVIGAIASALGIAGAIAIAGAAGILAAVSLHGPLTPAATHAAEPVLVPAEQSPTQPQR